MKNVRMAICVLVMCAVLFGGLAPAYGVVIFDDGASYYVDYDILESVYVRGNTVVEFGPGSYVKFSTFTYDDSRVIVSGGRLEDDIWAADNSTVVITAGEFCWGTLNNNGIPRLRGMSSVTIIGSDFKLDGVPVSGVLDLPWSSPPQYLTGTFLNGEYFSTAVDGHIVLVPEPTHILTIDVDPNDVGIDTVTPSVGTHSSGGLVSINAQQFVKCPDVYVFDHWEGDVNDPNSANTTVVVDSDKTITAVFVDDRRCGDECHPYPSADVNKDCKVDFLDIAMVASSWLECTKPECD